MTPAATSDRAPVVTAALGDGVEAWFTTSDAGNMSHHRPYVPAVLAADRAAVGAATGTDPLAWHLMVQVHGRDVAVIDAATPVGAEVRDVDGVVTTERDRVLGVAAADCVPVLLATDEAVGAVHAGRCGMELEILRAALAVLPGANPRAAVGPSIGGCCYEVPAAMQAEVCEVLPTAAATTTWGTPSLDLPRAAVELLSSLGVEVSRVGGCTRCTPGWFSHRRSSGSGRHLGLVVRR